MIKEKFKRGPFVRNTYHLLRLLTFDFKFSHFQNIGWYVRDLLGGEIFRQRMNLIEACDTQLAAVDEFFESQLVLGERLQYAPAVEKLAA